MTVFVEGRSRAFASAQDAYDFCAAENVLTSYVEDGIRHDNIGAVGTSVVVFDTTRKYDPTVPTDVPDQVPAWSSTGD